MFATLKLKSGGVHACYDTRARIWARPALPRRRQRSAAAATAELSLDRLSLVSAPPAVASRCPVSAARAALQPLLGERAGLADNAPGSASAAGPPHLLAWASDMLFLATRGIEAATLQFALRYGALCSFPNPLGNIEFRYGALHMAAPAADARSPAPPRWTFLASPELLEHVCASRASNYTARFLPDAYEYATHGRGVLGSSGARNRTARRLCGAPFAPGARSAVAFADAAVAAANRLGDVWASNAAHAAAPHVLDAADHAQRLTLDVIGEVAFSHNFGQVEQLLQGSQHSGDTLLRHVNAAQAAMGALFITPLPLLKVLSALRLQPVAGLDDSLEGMRREVAPIIAQRRAALLGSPGTAGGDGNESAQSQSAAGADLLDALLLAQEREGLTDDDIWEDVHDVLGAGHETTATALAVGLHALAADPSLAAELDAQLAVLGERRLTAADVADGKLWYAAALIKEALRLYPPIPLFPRVAAAADVLPGGHAIAPGEVVFMSAFAMGRLPSIWARDGDDKDVLRFDPLRFTPQAEAARHRFAYVPFGAGPRACLGAGFALTSATLMLATLARRFRFTLHGERARGQLLQVAYDITLHFPVGVPLRIEPKAAAAVE